MAIAYEEKVNVVKSGENVVLVGNNNFNLTHIFDCGQAFRFNLKDGIWQGVAFGKILKCSQDGDHVIFYNITIEEFKAIWFRYFTLDINYGEIIKTISENKTFELATNFADGIRILRQDTWEALCSFIISQNNNIPRIKGIIDRLCESFGEEIESGIYTFPRAEKLAPLSVLDLAPLRAGFRAKYIIDAAKKIANGEVLPLSLTYLPYETAKENLMLIKGVGHKVADCTLLFGCGRFEAFPIDVWIKRVMASLFPDGLPECATEYAGIAQQYLFYYARMNNIK